MIDIARDLERMRDYLGGRLSDDDHRAFEEQLSRDPDLVRELELSLRLREGLEQLRARDRLGNAADPSRRLPWALVAGLAAAVVIGIGLGLSIQRSDQSPSILTASLARGHAPVATREAVVSHFTFMTMRGTSAPILDLPAIGIIELRAAPPTPSLGARYRVTLDRLDADARSRVGSVAGLDLAAGGFVYCYADASRLRPGRYELRVEVDGESNAPAGIFAFSLLSTAPGS